MQVGTGADDDPDGGRVHAQPGRQEHGAGDDADVVGDRRQRRRPEAVLRVEDGRDDGAGGQEDRRDEHEARQLHGELRGLGIEAGHEQGHQGGSEDGQECRQDQQHAEHEVEDGGGHAPGALALPVGRQASQHRHQGRGDGTGRHQLEDEVGDAEGRVVGVQLRGRAVQVAEHDDAQPAQHARGQEGQRDDQPRPGQSVAAHGGSGGPSLSGPAGGEAEMARGWAAR